MHFHSFLLALIFPCVASAGPCSFVFGEATIGSGATGTSEGRWFTVTGRAELRVLSDGIEARLFDERRGGNLSHLLRGKWNVQQDALGRKFSASLRTYGSDAGDLALFGTYAQSVVSDGGQKFVSTSLVAQQAGAFVAVTCYEKRAP